MKTLGIILVLIVLVVVLYVVYKNTIGKTDVKSSAIASNIIPIVNPKLPNGVFVDANGNVIHSSVGLSANTGPINPNTGNEVLSYSQDLQNACTNLQKLLSNLNYTISANGNTITADGFYQHGSNLVQQFANRFSGNHHFTDYGYDLYIDDVKWNDYYQKGFLSITYNNTDKTNCLRIINLLINYWGSAFLGIS